MKQITIIMILLLGAMSYGQNNALSLIQSPGSLDDGFSIGVQYEHQQEVIYYGAELYVFPDLNNLDYNHLIGRFGLNHKFGGQIDKLFRIHSGLRAGVIMRDGMLNYALLGLEGGIDFIIPSTNIFIGLVYTSDMKSDSKLYSNDDHHTVNSGLVRLGFKF